MCLSVHWLQQSKLIFWKFFQASMPIYVYICALCGGGIWKIYRQRLIIEPRSFEILRRLRHDLKYARDA